MLIISILNLKKFCI